MRVFIILAIILTSSPIYGLDYQILKCLGEEEKRLHLKKDRGPIYDLNQRLLAEIIQIPKVEIKSEDYLEICTGNDLSESLKLLEASIIKGKALFILPKDLTGIQKSMTEGMIEDFIENTREIFLMFISQIQSQSPTPHCLKEEIPELDEFLNEIKYLQEDVEMKFLFKNKDQVIFKKLKNYPLAFEKCRARIKKKLKSESTDRAKKS